MVTVVARLVSMMLLLLLMLLVCLVHSTPEKRETRETREWTSRKNPNECETNSESIHLPVGGMGGDRSSRLELARRANRTPTLVTGVLQGTNRWMDGWMDGGWLPFVRDGASGSALLPWRVRVDRVAIPSPTDPTHPFWYGTSWYGTICSAERVDTGVGPKWGRRQALTFGYRIMVEWNGMNWNQLDAGNVLLETIETIQ